MCFILMLALLLATTYSHVLFIHFPEVLLCAHQRLLFSSVLIFVHFRFRLAFLYHEFLLFLKYMEQNTLG